MQATSEEMAEVLRLMENLEDDLLKMPKHKYGTRWHLDRQREWQRLKTKRTAMLSAVQCGK